jgi:hypothetical protein
MKDASVRKVNLRIPAHPAKAVCSPSPSGLRIERKSVIVSLQVLALSTSDELDRWAASLEHNGCIPKGQALALKASLIDALPLDLAKRRTLQGEGLAIKGSLNITTVNAFRVVSPVFRKGTPVGTATLSTEQPRVTDTGDGVVNIQARANPVLTGYEIAWYDVRHRDSEAGFRVVPRGAEIHIADKVEPESAPLVNHFDFEPDARWFRYFLMTHLSTDRNDYEIVLLSATTPRELEVRTDAFRKDAAGYLHSAPHRSYAAMSQGIGVNPYIRVMLNGTEADLQPGETLRHAVDQAAGPGYSSHALRSLSVLKPHNGKLARIEWDHATQDILNLTLEGGEQITW